METKATLIEVKEEIEINKKETPEFLLLLEQSVLLTLKEQGIINDGQLHLCMKELGFSD